MIANYVNPTPTDFNPATRQEALFAPPVNLLRRALSALAVQTYTYGVDLSHWQENVDFLALKASGIDYVILKISEGSAYVDERWAERWPLALQAGLVVMGYHFARSNVSGAAQAENLINAASLFLETVQGGTYLAWDVETADGASVTTRRAIVKAGLEATRVHAAQTGCYSSPALWNSLIGSVTWITAYMNWVAHWTSASAPTLPTGWTSATTPLWQYGIYPTHSWVRAVSGVSLPVDVNRYYGTSEQLKQAIGWTYTPGLSLEQKVERLWLAHPELH